TQSQEYTIEARVVDESDQLVAGRATVIVHQGDVYVGLRPEEYIGQAEQETAVNLVVVDWESEPVAAQEVDYEVVERVWSSVQEEDELGRTVWTWDVEEIPVEDGSGTVTTDNEGKAILTFVPANAGTYKIYGKTRDDRSNQIQSSTFMWVSGSEYVSWRQQNSNRFDLITNADSYKVGDTAEILIASPFQGETVALVTIERGDILQHDVIHMQTNSEVYRLPITDEHAPNIFVSVIIVKGVDEDNPYAQFRMGLTQLSVDTERLVLNIEITPDVDIEAGEFAGPGDDVTYKVKTTDWEGNPVSAEVGIGVTDLAVLSIASPNSGTLMDYFYHETGVAVRTSTPLSVSVDQTTQTIIDTVKGGGGGGDDAGIFDIRQEFVDTPGWKPDLVTDENGEGEYTVTLPDNLTTWRLDARAITRGSEDDPMLVGQTITDVLSTKPLLVRPLTPRFMVVDDVIEFGAIVNNNTGETQTVEISMQGTGFLLEDENAELTQTVEIPASGRQRVNWTLRVLDVPYIDVTFFASGNDGAYTDATRPTAGTGDDRILPVYKYEVPETVGTAGLLTESGSRSELIALPHRFDVTQGELTIKVDRSLAGATVDGLDYLENFPHQCIEQTVSRFLPNVMTLSAFTQLGLFDPELKANLDEAVNFAIQRLYSSQKVNGGWGWFPQSESSAIVTAYALIGL
ncbi:MAG TPA: alpha-2-macroglobulin family protein, partial [Aggregatilineales bacterium]|nr:alpha-2-macroglobulin family protein [Aggregatilineales bacterium]